MPSTAPLARFGAVLTPKPLLASSRSAKKKPARPDAVWVHIEGEGEVAPRGRGKKTPLALPQQAFVAGIVFASGRSKSLQHLGLDEALFPHPSPPQISLIVGGKVRLVRPNGRKTLLKIGTAVALTRDETGALVDSLEFDCPSIRVDVASAVEIFFLGGCTRRTCP